MKITILLLSLIVAGAAGASVKMDAQTLNLKLQAANAGWVAKDTPISLMSRADAQHRLGLKVAPHTDTEFVNVFGSTRANLPTVLDWRNKDGVNWVSPMLNQANCGSCVAFAAVGVMESMINIATGIANMHVRLSPQNLFSCGGGSCEMGWMPSEAASFLQTTGIPDESCLPYTSGATGEDVACNASCNDSSQRTLKIENFRTPSRSLRDVESVKQALQRGPVMTTMTVYGDFLSYANGIYKHVTGDALGGHAISIVGYDDTKQAYIIRNNWGTDWGDQGFAYVSYEDTSGIGDETYSFQMPSPQGAVSIAAPLDYAYATDTMAVKAASTFQGTSKMQISVFKDGAVAASGTCDANCDTQIATKNLADGRYEISITALDAGGKTLGTSVRHLVYVANHKPTLALSYTGKNVDLTQDLKGRIEFSIKADSSTVPMSRIEFHYKDTSGVEKTRTANIVLSEMSMGWRTNTIPQGRYEIWLVGHMTTNGFDASVESEHKQVNLNN